MTLKEINEKLILNLDIRFMNNVNVYGEIEI